MEENNLDCSIQEEYIYPMLPLRDIVVFPNMISPLFVGRKKSIAALEEIMHNDQKIFLVAQKDSLEDTPTIDDLYEYGTLANVLQMLKLPDGTVKVLVEGLGRAKLDSFNADGPYYKAKVEIIKTPVENFVQLEALSRAVINDFAEYVQLNKKISVEVIDGLNNIDDYDKLADTIASYLQIKLSEKQELLSTIDLLVRFERILEVMQNEISILHMEKKIRSRVKNQMEKTQREYYLNEQMKAIQKELNNGDDTEDEISALKKQIATVNLSEEAKNKANAEIKKLKNMSAMSAEAAVVRNYLDWLLNVPWNVKSKIKKDLTVAAKILDAEHYGLEEVKQRILEYLSVQARAKKLKGPILCFVGPPGVGKTSLAASIAKATGRSFARIALGGVRDESEIRGHRRTYIGAMPGKIIQVMKKAATNNPLILLDEIDKMGQDFRGDPASALLEVLDPAQNSTFVDHYLEVEYDLSNVMFITTANTLDIPPALLDRMEIVRLSGYTEDEKIEIANRYLLPKAISDHGLKKGELSLEDHIMEKIVQDYTKEAGVRNLQREIMKIVRKSLTEILQHKKKSINITDKKLADFLGPKRYLFGQIEKADLVGIVTGLAWTQVGGELLTIEGVSVAGKGRMTVTGNLKEVMKESIFAANSYVRSRCLDFGIHPKDFYKYDIHMHVPEGAIPKDGPSAGVAMMTVIVSILTGIPINKDVAMTGEITLRGRILPIGGLKEKLLAAVRGGIKKVLIPYDNLKDLSEIPAKVKNSLEIIPVSNASEVLDHALTRKYHALKLDENELIIPDNEIIFPIDDDLATSTTAH
ncbi:endopeptidase La [Bartonella sp. DGB1]|uniref:endopeptidase La n=1 Tax=Bartonella sp. DGB1 TaxID=3239807 RepID=UPI003526592D